MPDGAVQFDPRAWFPGGVEDVWTDYLNESGHLVGGVGALLVERGERALLIDAGFGPYAIPPRPGEPRQGIHGGALPDNLAALGRSSDRIEAVAFTHLHLDHIGWARTPGFAVPNYLVSQQEWAERHLLGVRGVTEEMLQVMAPRVRTVIDGEEVFPGVRVMLAPGHTAGHATYVISDGGRRVIAFGDAMHSPLQIAHPDWSSVVDLDPRASAKERRRLVEELAAPEAIGFGVHFADVVFGRVRQGAWQPL